MPCLQAAHLLGSALAAGELPQGSLEAASSELHSAKGCRWRIKGVLQPFWTDQEAIMVRAAGGLQLVQNATLTLVCRRPCSTRSLLHTGAHALA